MASCCLASEAQQVDEMQTLKQNSDDYDAGNHDSNGKTLASEGDNSDY